MRDEAGLAGEKAAVRWGLGGGRHCVMPGAARGPVAGPACRACIASANEGGGQATGAWTQQQLEHMRTVRIV